MESDKRSHERVKVDGDVRYSDAFQIDNPQILQKDHEGQLMDISSKGICICTKHEYKPGSIIQFNIRERYNENFTGIVKRCIKYSDDIFHVGIEVPFKLI